MPLYAPKDIVALVIVLMVFALIFYNLHSTHSRSPLDSLQSDPAR